MRMRLPGGLWRHPDFLRLWSAETISQFGSRISEIGLPLVAIYSLQASVFEIALLGLFEFLPFILLSLPAGVWIDRFRRKPILIAADLVRAGLLLSVPAAYFAEVLTIWQLYGVGLGVGACTVFFDIAYQSYIPSLIERDQLVEGNARLEVSRSVGYVGGPAVGGVLVSIFTAPYAILVDALSFLGSAALLVGIRKPEEPPVPQEKKTSMLRDVREGLGWVLRNRYLRPLAISMGARNLFTNMTLAILIVYAVRELDISVGMIGVMFALGEVGSLIAAVVTTKTERRLGIGGTILGSAFLIGPGLLLVALAPKSGPLPFIIAGSFLINFANVMTNITQLSFRQAITPEHLQGRMNSVIRFIIWGTLPLGALAGGAFGTWLGLRETVLVAAAGCFLSLLPLLFSPLRTLRNLPGSEPTAAALHPA